MSDPGLSKPSESRSKLKLTINDYNIFTKDNKSQWRAGGKNETFFDRACTVVFLSHNNCKSFFDVDKCKPWIFLYQKID